MESTTSFAMSGVEVVLVFLIFYGTLAVGLFFIARWALRVRRASAAKKAVHEGADRSELLELKEQLESLRSEVGSLQEQQGFLESLLQRPKEPRG